MIKNTIYTIILFSITICDSIAQDSEFKPHYFAMASVGSSLRGLQIKTEAKNNLAKSSSVYDISFQKRASKNVAFGLCFAYQILLIPDNNKNPQPPILLRLISPGIVASYVAPLGKNLEIYLHTKFTYYINQYNIKSGSKIYKVPIMHPSTYTIQIGSGFNYYFSKNLGLNVEGAIGIPYFIKFGLIYRFGYQNATAKKRIEKVEPIKRDSNINYQ